MDSSKYIEDGFIEAKIGKGSKEVFLIGDSIREGYCPYVKEYLANYYEVLYPNDNCRNTQYVLTSLKSWTNMFDDLNKVKVVCFNCGHWDIAHWNGEKESLTTIEDYSRNLRRIVEQLRIFFPSAKVVFFTTTPVSTLYNGCMTNPRSNEEIEKYNLIASMTMNEQNVKVHDLFKVVKDYGECCFKDYCHLTEEYNAKLGNYVANILKKMIE